MTEMAKEVTEIKREVKVHVCNIWRMDIEALPASIRNTTCLVLSCLIYELHLETRLFVQSFTYNMSPEKSPMQWDLCTET